MISVEELRGGQVPNSGGQCQGFGGRLSWPSWKEMKQIMPTIGFSSVLGILMESCPVPAAISAPGLPTNSAKKRSKASEMFGKGAIEGIAASGKRQTML